MCMSTNVKINMHVYDKLRMCMYFWYVNMHVYVYECCTVAGKWLTLFGSMEKKGERVSSASIVAHQRAVEGQHGSRATWHIEVMMLLIALRFPRGEELFH